MTPLEIITICYLLLIGAGMAGFLHMAAIRRARGDRCLSGRSRCPVCGSLLRFYELIPVVSWIFLAGRCRHCKAKIAVRFLIAELIGALSLPLIYLRFGVHYMTPIILIVTGLLFAIAIIDITTREIPNGLIIALVPLAAAAAWAQPEIDVISRAIGFAVVSLPMFIMALIVHDSFGAGDIKLIAVCGFMMGWQGAVLAFVLAAVTGAVFATVLIIRKKLKRKELMPFGQFLCLGVYISLLCGGDIISRYLELFGL